MRGAVIAFSSSAADRTLCSLEAARAQRFVGPLRYRDMNFFGLREHAVLTPQAARNVVVIVHLFRPNSGKLIIVNELSGAVQLFVTLRTERNQVSHFIVPQPAALIPRGEHANCSSCHSVGSAEPSLLSTR